MEVGYPEYDYLPLSGLQHYAFCPRQWALIHVEQQWKDNCRTVEYKRGSEKLCNADRVQLCAQAMPLEEMFGCSVAIANRVHRAEALRSLLAGGARIEISR